MFYLAIIAIIILVAALYETTVGKKKQYDEFMTKEMFVDSSADRQKSYIFDKILRANTPRKGWVSPEMAKKTYDLQASWLAKRGIRYHELGFEELATNDLREALSLNPKEPNALPYLEVVHAKTTATKEKRAYTL
jgi:lipoprotein NlpI